MAIGYKNQTGASVSTPSSGETWTFIDSSDGHLKRKDSTGTITDIETASFGSLSYQGAWDANGNNPTLVTNVGTKGHYYVVNIAGTTLINGVNDWEIGDWIVFNGTIWEKIDNTDKVGSVFGRTGTVVSASGDYTASQITNVPAGGIAATTVQAALNELDGDKLNNSHAGSGGSAHADATTSVSGFMSSADKTKLDGIPSNANAGITALTGEVSASGVGSVAATLSNAAVIAKVLTGLTANWNLLSSSDSILQGFGKLLGLSTMAPDEVSSDTTIPSGYTWTRHNIKLTGTAKLTVLGKLKLI